MVSPTEAEIFPIWERIKTKISVFKIKSVSPEGLTDAIETKLKESSDKRVRNLLNSNFSKLASSNEKIIRQLTLKVKPKTKIVPAKELKLPEKIKKGVRKTTIKTKKFTKIYNTNILKFSVFTFKSKEAFGIYNVKLKKRITWGLVE